MRVFLSWSGARSKAVALALYEWLPNVIQAVDPWMSSEDIEKGARWSDVVGSQLATTSFGIVCVTQENQHKPWLPFEAGALSKTIIEAHVATLLIDLTNTEVTGPLAQFQHTNADRSDLSRLLATINANSATPLAESKLFAAFDRWWSDLEARIEAAKAIVSATTTPRKDRELLEEVLSIVRATGRGIPAAAPVTGLEGTVVPQWFEEYVRSRAVVSDAGESSMGIAIQDQFADNALAILSNLTCPIHNAAMRANVLPVQQGRAQVNIQACCPFALLVSARRLVGYVDIR